MRKPYIGDHVVVKIADRCSESQTDWIDATVTMIADTESGFAFKVTYPEKGDKPWFGKRAMRHAWLHQDRLIGYVDDVASELRELARMMR